MNILFIGTSSLLSLIPLQRLILSRHQTCAIATNDDSTSIFTAIAAGSVQSVAFRHSIPLINLNTGESKIIAEIKSFQPDVILVSCYPKLIPNAILSLAKHGAFNLHPSLLPKYRGPSPLFWQIRDGISNYGVTLHRMNSCFDTGNIVLQENLKIRDGIHINEVNKLIANCAAELSLKFLDMLTDNNVKEIEQDERFSSYQSFPKQDDYRVDVSWTAKQIYNFICAYKAATVFFLCEIEGQDYELVDAFSYQDSAYTNMKGKCTIKGNVITFACSNSFIQCKIKSD